MKNFIRKLLKPKDPIVKTEIYSYIFPEGIYVGYTTIGLDYVEYFFKTFHLIPISWFVLEYNFIKPKVIKTVMLRRYDKEIYKYMREAIDECGYKPECLLNKNLHLYGYGIDVIKKQAEYLKLNFYDCKRRNSL